ncbi:MotA/TolQ/ExbB proton channel family protein [Halopseudomonas phragmitis]|uniref:MotA/TolQ/ExbB proton channel domain-containing protein n=1 Tax=Halopseudomonas phragmitis TaxID=1931241 RepID=A0A1V0B1K3_9GAMM|nr:MotA/TolQ/ExbB proton channel family protein [Halopseudomonas phragmitis]AQZ93654.1 hypothetical protein BVH74_02270 [Halopseudomonas phragmitis]
MFTTLLSESTQRWLNRARLAAIAALLSVAALSAGYVIADTAAVAPAESAQIQPLDELPAVGERFGVREMFEQADWVVKSVMIFLVLCSLLTWAVLLEKLLVFVRARRANQRFLTHFRAGTIEVLGERLSQSAMGRMWQAGMGEYQQFCRQPGASADAGRVNRMLQRMSLNASIVQERDLARLGSMMGVLATIGATAPFIGLFGTVWGILNSFASIATMRSASLAIVAPGIAEALLATALGLFAAIPAVMIFNKFARDINGFVGALDNFSAEMIASVSRKIDEGH